MSKPIYEYANAAKGQAWPPCPRCGGRVGGIGYWVGEINNSPVVCFACAKLAAHQ